MAAQGNENSSRVEADYDTSDQESYYTSRDNDEQPVESNQHDQNGSNGEGGGFGSEDSAGDDETSDPVVVSPPSSPQSFINISAAPSNQEKYSLQQRIPSFIMMGVERKASPREIKSWAALALTLDGRDKITKVLQYTARFLGWWFAGGRHRTQSIRFTALYKSLANSRKAYRLGRSFIELEKLRPTAGSILWHLENRVKHDGVQNPNSKFPICRASSNTGWGPSTADEDCNHRTSLVRSLSSMTYRRMYRPILSRLYSTFAPDEEPTTELWKICGMSIKVLGLLLFWAGDNCSFLFSTGMLDNYSLPSKERSVRRKQWMSFASERAGQAYFVGSLAGLFVNWSTYSKFLSEHIVPLEHEDTLVHEDSEIVALRAKKLKQKQFSLFLSLLKVCTISRCFLNLIANLM